MGTFVLQGYAAWCCCLVLIQITIVSSASISSSASTGNVTPTTPSVTTQITNSSESATQQSSVSTTVQVTTPAPTTTTTAQQMPVNTTDAAPTTKQTTKSSSQASQATTSSAPPTTPTVSQSSTTTESPSLGINCTGKPVDWCNGTISGAAQCKNNTCQCDEDNFQLNNNTCIPENDLKPKGIEISNVTSTSFIVTWSHQDSVKNLDLDYDVNASIVDNGTSIPPVTCNVNGGNAGGNVVYLCSLLSPGYMYEVEVTVTFGTSQSVNSAQDSTIPGTPGKVDETQSNLTYPDVTLIWKKSEGRVEYYHVRVFQNGSKKGDYSETTRDNMLHVKGLQPVTEYDIKIIANSHGKPSKIRNATFVTRYDAPDPVTNVTVEVLNDTSVIVSWVTANTNLNTSMYEVTTNNMIDNSISDQSCSVQGRNVSECIVSGLEEYWVYSFNVCVSALNTTSSHTVSENVTTDESVPGMISKAGYKLFDGKDNCNATEATVYWEEPNLYDRNSNITQYVLRFKGQTHFDFDYRGPSQYVFRFKEETHFDFDNPDPYKEGNREFKYNISKLHPQTNNSVEILAVNSKGSGGPAYTVHVVTDVCAPPDWKNQEVYSITMKQSTPSSVTIQVPNSFFKKTEQGSLYEKGFIVLPKGSFYFDGEENIIVTEINDWQTSKNKHFKEEFKIIVKDYDIMNEMFVIGKHQCSGFCNGPLPEHFSFKIAAYACTLNRSGVKLCTVTIPVGLFATTSRPRDRDDSPSTVVIILAILMVLLAALAAFTFLWYKDYINPALWFSKKTSDDEEDRVFTSLDRYVKNRPIKVCDYVSELEEMHKDTNLMLSDQYEDINKFGQMIAENSTTENARHENNTPKNRWVNILPFDHSRVKLQQIDEDEPTSDYINANFMPGFNNMREYIATQGPLPGTIDDFWRMIWEHGVMVIVMLTQCKEGNRVKCEKYWPDELREAKQYGDVVVNPISISQLDKYNISIFEVSLFDETRQVIHFHYLDFPDFSANVEFDHFINFVRTVRSHVPHDMKGPMVIHCSAGVGRTGTFIATDRLHLYLSSDEFSEEGEVDIYGIVISMRENRVAMVQTESQYIMIHDCFEKMLEEKREALKAADSDENLYENQAFEETHPGSHPYPETLYENVSAQEQTEL